MTVNKQKNWQAVIYSKMSNRTTGSWIEIIPRIQWMPLYDQLLCTLTTWHCFKHCWFTTGSWKKCFWHPWIFLYQQNGNPANINQYTSQCCVVGQLDSRPWQVHINMAKLTLQQWRLAHLTTACVKCVTTCKILVKKTSVYSRQYASKAGNVSTNDTFQRLRQSMLQFDYSITWKQNTQNGTELLIA